VRSAPIARLLRFLPLVLAVLVVRLGYPGTTGDGSARQVLGATALAGWTTLGLVAVRRRSRWRHRR
jgi:hypothetical protein